MKVSPRKVARQALRFVSAPLSRRGLVPRPAPSTAPGTAGYVGARQAHAVQIHVYSFTEKHMEEIDSATIADAASAAEATSIGWVDVNGIHNADLVRALAQQFGLHVLSIEDILNPSGRTKAEYFNDYVFLVSKMIYMEAGDGESPNAQPRLVYEQVSLILGRGFVLTFQQRDRDVFDPVRMRLREAKGRIRKKGSDYLAYALLDAIVDNYVVVLEQIGRRIEALEDLAPSGALDDVSPELHRLKRELLTLRKAVWPLHEAASALMRDEQELVAPQLHPYLRDLLDHLVHVIESIDIYREMVMSLQDLHLSALSQRMNEEMRILTVIATIFIPLTFIAGVYGMNFEHMPELGWRYGYPTFWLLVSILGASLILYFRKKRWL